MACVQRRHGCDLLSTLFTVTGAMLLLTIVVIDRGRRKNASVQVGNLREQIVELRRPGAGGSLSCTVGERERLLHLGDRVAAVFERARDGSPLSCYHCHCDLTALDASPVPQCYIEDCSESHRWCPTGATGSSVEATHPCCSVCPPRRAAVTSTAQPEALAIDSSIPLTGDIYNATFRHLPDSLCAGPQSVLLAVTSRPESFERRALLRSLYTADAARHGVQLMFLLGRPGAVRHAYNDFRDEEFELEPAEVEDRERRAREAEANASVTQRLVDTEAAEYGDLIQSDVPEHYFHLTLKTVSLLDAVERRCGPHSRLRFIAKTDDDVWVNIPLLAREAEKLSPSDGIHGRLEKNPAVGRSPFGWYSSVREWPWSEYPRFVLGPGYLVPASAAGTLLSHALRTRYHHLEDVFVTGIVAHAAGVMRTDWPAGLCTNMLSAINVCQAARCVFTHKVHMDGLEETLHGLANASRRFPLHKLCQQTENGPT